MFNRIALTVIFCFIYTMIATVFDELVRIEFRYFRFSIPFVTIGFYYYLRSKDQSIKGKDKKSFKEDK